MSYVLNFFPLIRDNADIRQAFCAIAVVVLTLVMTIYAHRALRTYKSQILFEIEIESKALALRTFELYLKLNLYEFHEHLLKGQFLEQYNGRHEFYGNDFVEKTNDALIRRLVIEQVDSEIEDEMKQIRLVVYKVLSTFQNRNRYMLVYDYYSEFFTFYQCYKLNYRTLTGLIFEHYHETESNRKQALVEDVQSRSTYFSYDACQKRNDKLQLLMEKATNIN